jgi:chromosome segregation protein
MVHIKSVELTNFKSFGGTTKVPLLPGFTVISGPNGSGKSNILDALLFALGLASSKGMRAERLPDLVNNSMIGKKTVETIVVVCFDISDLPVDVYLELINQSVDHVPVPVVENTQDGKFYHDIDGKTLHSKQDATNGHKIAVPQELTISRKLRVTKQGTYTSTYYFNGEPCTQLELHERLNLLRVYPEGYNVVLQGDVTSIISMKPKERREIIDELAGVAQFDRKIVIAKEKLEEVREQEEKHGLVEAELKKQCERLSQDSIKARKYQQIRTELEEKLVWQVVLQWQNAQKQAGILREKIEEGDRSCRDLTDEISQRETIITQAAGELETLNAQVKALGEAELLAQQSTLAKQEAEQNQLQQRREELQASIQQLTKQIADTAREISQQQKNLEKLATEQLVISQNVEAAEDQKNQAETILQKSRDASTTLASNAEGLVKQQTDLHRQIETLQETLNPLIKEQARLREQVTQLDQQTLGQQTDFTDLEQEIATKQQQYETGISEQTILTNTVQELATALAQLEEDLQLQQATQTRLQQEQREHQRQLDKLEAQQQAIQESSGSHAAKIFKQSNIKGICGLVAELGKVAPKYQLALETAAGNRLTNMVVETDAIAAQGIELLKRQKAGRMTFLPLNKIRPPQFNYDQNLRSAQGFIDYAINLIECDRSYDDVFAYVFGNTVVFQNVEKARQYLGSYRIVTLDGELLETSGAMTGGSISQRSSLHFGTVDNRESQAKAELASHQQRLKEIEHILSLCAEEITTKTQAVKQQSAELNEVRQSLREKKLFTDNLATELTKLNKQLSQTRSQLSQNHQNLTQAQARLIALETEIPSQEEQLQLLRQTLTQLEASHSHTEWQKMQILIRSQEAIAKEKAELWRQATQQLQDTGNQQAILQEKIVAAERRKQEYQENLEKTQEACQQVISQLTVINDLIAVTVAALAKIEAKLGAEKQKRDEVETQVRDLRQAKQELAWQLEKQQAEQATRRQQLTELQNQLQTQKVELPDPLPTIPPKVKLSELEKDVRSLQKQLQALEPVNMLALEEYDQTQNRLEELSQKLTTLAGERTELLLRIENFTTLRQRSFFEAFNAVNENFQTIFAELSQGDGHLQLDQPEDPFNSGLQLVAHPKGKPVQRLASMSGGEKSLTALSFIFSLQRYRPSPFYAFDEVDMFLDGANVERLSKMIKRQSQAAQFIVVSLRRPMMESSERAIGVTQARGAHTQVLGIKI